MLLEGGFSYSKHRARRCYTMAVWTERILQSRLQTKGNEEISRKCVHSHESILIDSTEAKQKLE